jgi:hypothetical protein
MGDKPDKSAATTENRWSAWYGPAIAAIVIYVLPLLALAVDEFVLGTYWIHRQFPPGARTVFFDAYPFLTFLE